MDYVAYFLQYGAYGIALLRIGIGIVFLKHGMMKFGMWKMQASEQMSAGMLNILRALSIVESVAGLAMIAGLFTQLAALSLGIIMLGAIYFKIFKWKKPFAGDGGWEFDFILLVSAIMLYLNGGGAFGIDKLIAF